MSTAMDRILLDMEETVAELCANLKDRHEDKNGRITLPAETVTGIRMLLSSQSTIIKGLQQDSNALRETVQDTINRLEARRM